MTDVLVERLEEHTIEGKRLGRHVEHDPHSRDYAYVADLTATTLKSVHHRRYGTVFDQGQIGSCTGNACAGALNTVPLHVLHQPVLHESDALDLYELATHIDTIHGVYPPDDTGSSGLAVAKAAKNKGYITSYRHAFSMDGALGALQVGPVITGVPWYEGFDNPDPDTGLVEIAGQIRGGHEFEILGFQLGNDVSSSLVVAENSWGADWGLSGRFKFTVSTWQRLLEQQGDVTILIKS